MAQMLLDAVGFRSAMSPPKRQHPAIGLRLICDHLAQVSLPNLERGALLRQSFVLIVNFVDVAVGMGQHGQPIVPRNPKACQSGRERAPKIMRCRPIGLEARHRVGVVAAMVELLDDAAQRLRQTMPRQPGAFSEFGGENKFRLCIGVGGRAVAQSRHSQFPAPAPVAAPLGPCVPSCGPAAAPNVRCGHCRGDGVR